MKKPLKTVFGSPVVPRPDGAMKDKDGSIGWWWFNNPDGTPDTYIAVEDIQGGILAIWDYLDQPVAKEFQECPF